MCRNHVVVIAISQRRKEKEVAKDVHSLLCVFLIFAPLRDHNDKLIKGNYKIMFRTENFISRRYHISIANQILVSIAVGIFTGLFFGDLCRFLLPVSDIYTMLLEVAIYPYIIATLLCNLGKLNFTSSLRLFKNGVLIYLLLVALIFFTLIVIARAFPITTSAIKLSTAAATSDANLLNLIIPDNLFEALSNNYVPAVVLFCILFGVMLQRVKGEHVLFKILDTLSKACIEFWDWLIKFAPIGVFATIAYAAGTLHVFELKDAAEYLLLFFFGAFLLAFWLLPALISSFTDLSYRLILRLLRDVLIISVSTTMSILALPYLYKIIQDLLAKRKNRTANAKEIIQTTNLISYPFGQLGNCFVYLFLLFASTYFNHPISEVNTWLLPITSYLASLGSPDTAVNAVSFLSSWLKMPNDIFTLYSHLALVTIYPQVLVSVMCIAFIAILSTFAYYGLIKLQWKKLFTHIFLIAILLIIFIFCARTWVPNPGIKIYQRLQNASINPAVTAGVEVVNTDNVKTSNNLDAFFRIQKSGIMRVGYYPAAMPFSFFNTKGELVGYDVAHMYMLAKDLKVKIQFIPYTWASLLDDLKNNKFDIAIGGVWANSDRIEAADLSNPYIRNPAAFLVPKNKQNNFSSLERIQALPKFRLGIYYDPYTIASFTNLFPNIEFYPIRTDQDITDAFAQNKIDAMLLQEISGMLYSLGHPGLAVVNTPPGIAYPYLVAYMIPKNSEQLRVFLDYWLDLQKNNGFSDTMYNRWILGRPPSFDLPRWSILRNILHYGEERQSSTR